MERIAKPTPADILAALKASAPGDVVIVEGDIPKGTYADLRWPLDAPPVTLRSDGIGAGFVGYSAFRNCANLRLERMDARAVADTATVAFLGCEGVTWAGGQLRGFLGPMTATDPRETFKGSGVQVADSRRVRLDGLEFVQLGSGFSLVRCNDVEVTGCRFRNLRADGGQVTDHGDRLVFSRNDLADFWPLAEDHADPLQVRLSNAATRPTRGVVCEDNVIRRGAGRVTQSGLFLTGTVALPIAGVEVRRNAVLGMGWNAIRVSPAAGDAVIEDNLVIGFAEFASWIMLVGEPGGRVADNRATSLNLPVPGVAAAGNVILGQMDAAAAEAALADWLRRHDDPRDIEIAELREVLASARASVASLNDINQRLAAQRDDLLARVAAAEARVERVRAALA